MARQLPIVALRTVLGLSEAADTYWHVEKSSEERELYLCHYLSEMLPDLAADAALTPIEKATIEGLRGVIVSLAHGTADHPGRIVTRSFGYTPICTVDGPISTDLAKLKDQDGHLHEVNFADPRTSVAFNHEGTVIKVSKYFGEYFRSTARSFDITNSRWGNSPTFAKCYADLGGPDPETLFDKTKPSSNVTYLFMIVHPALQVASRLPVGSGYLAYLGFTYNNPPASLDPTVYELEPSATFLTETVDAHDEGGRLVVPVRPPTDASDPDFKPALFSPTKVNGAEGRLLANIILTQGVTSALPETKSDREAISPALLDDPRLLPGEACIVNYTDADGQTKMIKLASIAYNWRVAVCGNDPNRYHRLVCLRSYALPGFLNSREYDPYVPAEGETLRDIFNGSARSFSAEQLFPYIATPTGAELESLAIQGPEVPTIFEISQAPLTKKGLLPLGSEVNEFRDRRMANIALCFILAVAPSYYNEACGYLSRLTKEMNETMTFLVKNFPAFKAIPTPGYRGALMIKDRDRGYIDNLEDRKEKSLLAIQAFTLKRNGDARLNPGGHALVRIFKNAVDSNARTTLEIAQDNLRNFLRKEYGSSLYSIITTVKAYMAQLNSQAAQSVPGLASQAQ